MYVDRQLDTDLQEDFLDKIGREFGVDSKESSDIFYVLLNCMDYRLSVSRGMGFFLQMEYFATSSIDNLFVYPTWIESNAQITIFDSESEDQQATDSAILTSVLKGISI